MQYTLKQLRYFAAAAEQGSVTAAARAIRVSQPSIWKRLSTCSCSCAITRAGWP